MIIHAETSQFNLTLFDSYVNMLRTQTEAMSAAIAGVESITVTPYDAVYETPTDFAMRIAKNQQLILKHESHLDKVADPAGGSYYIESLTASIAAEAWKLFLAIENGGGFHKAVKEGKVQADIVVICSSDDEYAEYAIPAFRAIGDKAIFIVAGAPACMPELQSAGIENFIHVRVNVLETLKELNRKLGI